MKNGERWQPVPIPNGDGRHDIGDDMRAAIVKRLVDDWSHDPDLSAEKARQLAMWAAASVRSLIGELGILRDMDRPPVSGVDFDHCSQHPDAPYELHCMACLQESAATGELEQQFVETFTALALRQQALDPVAAKVLYDNLWRLYDDSDPNEFNPAAVGSPALPDLLDSWKARLKAVEADRDVPAAAVMMLTICLNEVEALLSSEPNWKKEETKT